MLHRTVSMLLAKFQHIKPFLPADACIKYCPPLCVNCEVVPSLSDDAQKRDPELCRFMELLHEHTEKPQSKLLVGESPNVKVFYFLWYQFRV